MADFAFLAELAIVRLVLFVAVNAFPRRLAEFLLRIMATGATHFFVTVAQRKIRLIVVEGGFIQQHDIEVTAFVVRMTDATQLGVDLR